MLRDRKTQQQGEYELVLLEELVPQDHFLRKVDAAVDSSFIHRWSQSPDRFPWIVQSLYSNPLKLSGG